MTFQIMGRKKGYGNKEKKGSKILNTQKNGV
jgi:hypothetical protein